VEQCGSRCPLGTAATARFITASIFFPSHRQDIMRHDSRTSIKRQQQQGREMGKQDVLHDSAPHLTWRAKGSLQRAATARTADRKTGQNVRRLSM